MRPSTAVAVVLVVWCGSHAVTVATTPAPALSAGAAEGGWVCAMPERGKYPVFDEVAEHAWRSCAITSQRDIDAWSNHNVGDPESEWAPNQHVLWDDTIQAARMWTVVGRKGVPLGEELSLPIRMTERPAEGDTIVLSYEVWFDPATKAFYQEDLQRNGGTKFGHPRGSLGDWSTDPDGDYKDGIFKLHIWTRGKPTGVFDDSVNPPLLWKDSPYLGGFSMQVASEYVGANTKDVEPWQPARWGRFPIEPGVWMRLVFIVDVHEPLDEPVSTFSAFLMDEHRPAMQMMGDGQADQGTGKLTSDDLLNVAVPWSEERQQGMWRLHLLQNWKEVASRDFSMAVRNFVFLTQATDADVKALVEGPVAPSGGVQE